ncbi:FAD:protein FMN transferase [BD1-7 clade bacterium]|uniref:FAD:protein FMN transferase n=1 Tax=BD1-7 clade bacterium TaxID=2029982 RepID=A0A5S9Q638_9GAMM|nr:FAD:protein FMN transferase [BD1-7 clade bacterium]CAA0113963.1 FAD:protein FMN transferase [BD1-7 clade bacterium]
MYRHRFNCMTVACEVILHGVMDDHAKSIVAAIEANTRRLETKYNFHNPYSWLSRVINQRQIADVPVDAETWKILSHVKSYTAYTGELFDITVGTLKQANTAETPEQHASQVAELRQYMGDRVWSLDDDCLRFTNAHCQFDLGGVVKEYAVDDAVRILKQYPMSGALINFGGDIYVYGKKESGDPFRVGIKNPKNPAEPLCMVKIENKGLTTSGHYERQRKIAGEAHSHIIGDIDRRILSVTVVTDTVLESGIYSTALTMDPRLEIPAGAARLFIDDQLEIHQSLASS